MKAEQLNDAMLELLANQVDLRARIDALECVVKGALAEGSPAAESVLDDTLLALRRQRREALLLKLEDEVGARLAAVVSQMLDQDAGSTHEGDGQGA